MKQTILTLFLFLCFIAPYTSSAQTKSEKKCKSEVFGGKYNWATIGSLSKEPSSVYGFVLVSPKNIKQDFMIQLATRLRSVYCNADRFEVVIFDNRNYANGNSVRDYADSKGKIILMRGYYSFDRAIGKDQLEFSSKLGNPTTEIQIDLTKNR